MKDPKRGDDKTCFLNVDVDVWSKSDLQLLVDALGKAILVHYVGREDREYAAHFSLSDSHRNTADTICRRLATLIARLPPGPRRLWNRARARHFNIGIQGGLTPYSHEIAARPATLQRVAGVNASLVVTTYAA